MLDPIALIIKKYKYKRNAELPALPEGYAFLSDPSGKILRDETKNYLIDRKDENNG